MGIDDIIDREQLAQRLDNDIELFSELADIFIEDSIRLLNNIEDSIMKKDSDRLKKLSHTLKGSVSNFSAEKAIKAALLLENIGKKNKMDEAETAFKTLKVEIDNTILALKQIKEENKL